MRRLSNGGENQVLPRYSRAGVAVAAMLLATVSANGVQGAEAQGFDPNFPPELSPVLPSDVNPQLVGELLADGMNAQAQRVFDIFSWQSFLAINWPTNAEMQPAPSITDYGFGPPLWTYWKESYEVFTSDGSTPQPWGSPRTLPTEINGVSLTAPGETPQSTRILHNLSSVDTVNITVLDEVVEAFTHPLWDQNGNLAHYEILLNEDEFNYIVENELYNLEGQIAFSQDHYAVNFPSGQFGNPEAVGAIELKLAWKVIDESAGDIPSRFFTTEAFILTHDGELGFADDQLQLEGDTQWERVQVGMIGMHISHKTESSPQWIWSTFEHVDNLQVNALETVEVDGEQRPLRASFNNPDCATCLVNTYPPTQGADGKLRTQVTRVIPIPDDLQALNAQVQAILAEQGSIWQYYELIGTQWPTDPSAPPTTPGPGTSPDSIANKSGGRPTPVYLTNSVMETYFQAGNTAACAIGLFQPTGQTGFINGIQPPDCGVTTFQQGIPFLPPGVTSAAGGFSPDTTQVFGTEGCVGCHTSAGIARTFTVDANNTRQPVFGPPLTADFSWLFQQKAVFADPTFDPNQHGDSPW